MSYLEARKQEEKEQRRNAIIDAAEAAFCQKGPDAATMGDIAKEARLSRALLYVYFKDKDAIGLAVTLRALRALRETFERAVAKHEQGLYQIRAVGEAYVQFARREPVHFEALARFEARQVDPDDAASYAAACLTETDRLMRVMTGAVQAGIDDGSIRADLDPTRTAMTLWAYTHGLIQIAAQKPNMLRQFHNLTGEALVQHGLDMAGAALTCAPE